MWLPLNTKGYTNGHVGHNLGKFDATTSSVEVNEIDTWKAHDIPVEIQINHVTSMCLTIAERHPEKREICDNV